VGQKPSSWAPEWKPYTIIGDERWQDYEVSADVLLESGGWAGVMGRVNNVGDGYGCTPKGYYFRLGADGTYAVIAINGKAGEMDLGDKEHQAALKADGNPTGERGERQITAGAIKDFDPQQWHNVKLQMAGNTISGFVDGAMVLSTTNTMHSHGMAGLVTGEIEDNNKTRCTAYFDNLLINTVGGPAPSPELFKKEQTPIYKP
jgi:galactosylceramidase